MKVLILGLGYTGKFLEKKLSTDHEVFSTSRQGPPHIQFDLLDRTTWERLPTVDYTFWTFPATPVDLVQDFLNSTLKKLGRLIVIGSTGSYQIQESSLIHEESNLDFSIERVLGEEVIRKSGGMVLRASGIYGPERNPLDWIKNGRVGPNKKLVNLIHIEDLTNILWSLALKGRPKKNYIATSEKALPWDEVIEELESKLQFQSPKTFSSSKKPSKRVRGEETLKELDLELKNPSIIEGILALNKTN